ncbi:olfactory receptor 51G2-like [Elephas maximus indicus]|uniref:olfactory receptor 51G2-like n=1 Tax=Elephas maximus indicus TaxID=99487 RepID=UPI002115E5AA|nr:olfactory receptor 51G2-like [Elephas maximus indicus]
MTLNLQTKKPKPVNCLVVRSICVILIRKVDTDNWTPSSSSGLKILGPVIALLPGVLPLQVILSDSNYNDTFFSLTGLPGLEAVYTWLSIPLCAMYVASLVGNSLILWVVWSEPTLHRPMYYFLSMLALTDLGLSASTLPTVLTIYMLGAREVAVDVCLVQLFFIHTFSIMESSVLLTMAFDRFVAIRSPLRYGTILTNTRVAILGLAVVVRGISLHIPAPIMLKKLPYCPNHLLSHSYCLHPDVMKLACADTRINSAYGLFVVLSTLGVDSSLIVLSYGLIFHTVLSIASKTERLKALNTCVSHICAVLLFYTPMIGLSMIHRFGKRASPSCRVLLSYLHFLTPPVLNPVVYAIKTKEVRVKMLHLFRFSRGGIRDIQAH